MPRCPRPELAGGIHHVYARGAVKQPIFVDDLDRRRYLSILAKVTHRMAWRCFAYCLMGNHMHLLIETEQPNLGRGMQRLHGTYGQAFNRRHEAAGHVFGSRFGSTSILTDPQFFVTVAYIARNPVAAGFCNAPEAWPWSSHLAVATANWPSWLDVRGLLARFGQDGGDALQRYLEFVAAEPKQT